MNRGIADDNDDSDDADDGGIGSDNDDDKTYSTMYMYDDDEVSDIFFIYCTCMTIIYFNYFLSSVCSK